MKNTITKALAAILLLAGISQAQAGNWLKPRPTPVPTAVAAVRG